jgi:hypothetical protein
MQGDRAMSVAPTTSTNRLEYETFTLIKNSDGTYSFKTCGNNYIRGSGDGGTLL